MHIPDEVTRSIDAHVRAAIGRVREDFASAAEDEDAMTGHLGALLQVGSRRVLVQPPEELAGEWRWTIRYTKFRGRGPSATERFVGADGIFELALEIGGRVDRKALLFQSKLGDRGGRRLVEQALTLSTWREAAAVLTYAPGRFAAYAIDDVLAAAGDLRELPGVALDTYLADSFLGCSVGDDELRYDARTRQLSWRAMGGEVVATRFSAGHRIALDIRAPAWDHRRSVDKQVSPGEMHAYRMLASDAEILSRSTAPAAARPAATRRQVASLYHPDRYEEFDDFFRGLATRRSQEINLAYERVAARARHAPDGPTKRRRHGRDSGAPTLD